MKIYYASWGTLCETKKNKRLGFQDLIFFQPCYAGKIGMEIVNRMFFLLGKSEAQA